jgi:hypothetical protein
LIASSNKHCGENIEDFYRKMVCRCLWHQNKVDAKDRKSSSAGASGAGQRKLRKIETS